MRLLKVFIFVQKLPMRLLKNKYFIAIMVFIIWMLFFDQNKIGNRYKLSSQLRQLEQQKEYYQQEIEQNKKLTHKLNHDSAYLERFAREKYLMKRDNEEIYVIVQEE